MVVLKRKARSINFPRYGYLGFVVLLVGVLIFVSWRVTHGSSRLAEGVTVEAIRIVQSGMTEEEVVAILGEPLERAPLVNYPDAITLTYSKPAYFAKWYPMLWIHLRNGRVFDVYAKRYIDWGIDDVGVYGTGNDRQWETSLFEQTFPLKVEE